MNTVLIQPDLDEQQQFNKGSCNPHTITITTSNCVTSHNKLQNTINNDIIPLIATTNNLPNDPTSITATATMATTAVAAQQQRGHGIYSHRLSGSLSKTASISRDYLYPVGSHGSFSTSYDAFFTDDGYNEAEQGGIMTVPYTNGPVEFEDSRFYEGRYEDDGHDEYDYDASSSNKHGHGQHYQQQQQSQQQQHTPQRLGFSEEPMATEPTILAVSYRRHHQQSNRTQPVEQLNDQGGAAPLTASALLSPLRYRDVESTFGIRNEADKDEYRYHLPSQSQLFQSEFTTGMSGAGYLEESVVEDNNHDDEDGMMRDESEKKRKGSRRQQPGGEQEMDQDEQRQLQESGEEDDGDDDEEGGDENDDEEEDNNGRVESDDGEDDDEDDEGEPGRGAKGRKKSGRPVTSQKTIPKAMVSFPSIQQKHHSQQHGQHLQSDLMQHCSHHNATHRHQSMPQLSHYQTQQQLHQVQQQHQHSTSPLSLSSSTSSTSTSTPTSSYHSGNFISEQQFLILADDYLLSLSPKKREKALLSNSMYQKILMVLIQPKNTQVSTAQFRFWAKKMFTLSTTPTHHVVCHGGKPVATKECLYDVLVYCHRKSSHGGRDKTSAEVRQHYSWVPKELIARFVKHCPLCLSRRSTQQRQNGGPVAGATNGPAGSLSLDIDGANPMFLESHHGQQFESNSPMHGSATAHMSNGGGEGKENRENSGEDNGDIDVDQGGAPGMHSCFGEGHREIHSALSSQQQPTFGQQPQSGAYGHQQQHHHRHTSFSSMQRTGFDALQSPNSPIGSTHEGSQPWTWRKTGLGDVDSKDDGSIDRRQQQQYVGNPSPMMTTLHDGTALQDFLQADNDNDDGMKVDQDLGHDHKDENDDIHKETSGHQAEIQDSMDLTRSSTTAVAVAHSGLYYNKGNNQGTAFSFDNDEDYNGGNSPSEMVGITHDLGQSDGHLNCDSAFLYHQHHHQQQQHQQQRLFQKNHLPHRHQHQHSVGLSRHHPYQHQHRHTSDTIPKHETTQSSQPVITVHPNGHILHDRHPIHNRARIMALANSAAAATAAATATGGDSADAPAIPPIHMIHQAALTLSQQYRHHHHHHQQQQQHQSHHRLPSASHPPYLQNHHQHQHHSHHAQQQHTQQLSYRQVMAQTTHSGVVSGLSSAFMYTFANPDDDGEDGAYDHEGSEEDLEDDGDDEEGPISDDGDEAELDEGGAEHGGGEEQLLLLSESGLAATAGQDSQMAD